MSQSRTRPPEASQPVDTMQALQTYIDDLDCDPPFHSNRPFHLPLQVPIFDHETLEEIPFKQRSDFSDKICR